MTYRKKLIEVALPLDAINRESAKEKSHAYRGSPSAVHLWWARRPLAACRAIIFASIVNDPGNDLPEEQATKERERLFRIIEELVKWENTTNSTVLEEARKEILKHIEGKSVPVLDPFCGGGAIPLEAQRLGLEAYASDLNPVAVLITKALIEIPPRFAGKPPVNPEAKEGTSGNASWQKASGLASDVRYYGKWMQDEAWKRIGRLYPKGPNGETIIAWIWARTVKCPNPACGAQIPLVRSFWLSNKKDRETWVQPIIDGQTRTVHFNIRTSGKPTISGTMTRTGTICLNCGMPSPLDYVRKEAQAGRMSHQLMAMIAEGQRSRIYLPPLDEHVQAAQSAQPSWYPTGELEGKCRVSVPLYGMNTFADLFTKRQLVAMTTFCELVGEARDLVIKHSGGDEEYATAVATYLAFAVDRRADYGSTMCAWHLQNQQIVNTFSRQALPMVWDFAESNPFSSSSGSWLGSVDWTASALETVPAKGKCVVRQLDSATALPIEKPVLTVTDPPYYDNVCYADLSDFFYVWLRRSIGKYYGDLFSTLLTPKEQELIASPYQFEGDMMKAEEHFETGLERAFSLIRHVSTDEYPMAVYYAFKQQEEDGITSFGTFNVSTGWEKMLQALLNAGFQITGTWPVRSERVVSLKLTVNALASSIVLICRARIPDAPMATRREFLAALRKELPQELKILMNGRVAPVDLSQAAIGPGMAVFSRYSKVLEADGSAMTVRTALQEINYFLEDYLAQQEGDLDVESQFCVAWFQQYGAKEGPFGEADVLSRAKNISVDSLARLGLMDAARGKVRLTLRENYEDGWDPRTQSRLTAWEACQRLVWSLSENGEEETGRLARHLGGKAEEARQLAYRLYGIADRKGWAQEASGYNALVASWPEIQKAAAAAAEETQGRMM